jgi:hypothetical protein
MSYLAASVEASATARLQAPDIICGPVEAVH